MAVSASRAGVRIHSLGLECKLFLGPFISNFISYLENVTSVLLITLGCKLWFSCCLCLLLGQVVVFLSSVLYFDRISISSVFYRAVPVVA